MNELQFTLTTDGSFDRVLLRHISWMLRRQLGNRVALQPIWADIRSWRKKPDNLAERIQIALDLYPCDLLFIHRDAEAENPEQRYHEIDAAMKSAGIVLPFVSVVPVRMTEAWLLCNETAVRSAAGNPNGREVIDIPVRVPDEIADPKTLLHNALRTASGLKGRRRRDFNVYQASHRIADYIEDFTPLHKLPAFLRLEKDIVNVLRSMGMTPEPLKEKVT